MGKLPELERRLAAEEDHLASKQGSARLLREVVTDEEIAQIVSRWTGIPVTRLQEGERDKLLRLGQILHERIVGQDEAVQAVTDAIIRARSGLKDPRQPIGSFLFLGPTGVGQDRAGQDPCRDLVRHRGQHGPAGHERVPGTAHRLPAGRRPARLRGV